MFAGVALSSPIGAFETNVGTWQYDGPRAWVAVTLKSDGTCLVGAMLKNGRDGGRIASCAYSVRDNIVQLEWKHKVEGETPEASRLFYDAVADALVIENEPDRILKREKPPRK
jgi:hypothetical protein